MRRLRSLLSRPVSPLRQFPTTGFKKVDLSEKVEEENWEWYEPGLFYPVRIGEVFHDSRYQILGKLGYGSRSTAWLGRDLKAHKYVTIKVCERDSSPIRREVAAYKHLETITTSMPGAILIRELLDSFRVANAGCEYQCLVHEPLGMSVDTLRLLSPGRRLGEDVLKPFILHVLHSLNFLHTDAKMIHGDLQARNFHHRIEDEYILLSFESDELEHPIDRKIDRDRVIYESRGLRLPKNPGRPILCDFGEARFGQDTYTDLIQPSIYRAPEVILSIPWTYSVDIWNVGVMMWHIFENKHVFNRKGGEGVKNDLNHLAAMVSLLGPPPLNFLQRSEKSAKYFDDAGVWKDKAVFTNPKLSSVISIGTERHKTSSCAYSIAIFATVGHSHLGMNYSFMTMELNVIVFQ